MNSVNMFLCIDLANFILEYIFLSTVFKPGKVEKVCARQKACYLSCPDKC